jgi:hypothetical protein
MNPIDERIKELCERATTADDSEVLAVFVGLRVLLAEHSEMVRYLAAKTLQRAEEKERRAKAA